MPRPVSKEAARVLLRLTRDLGVGESRKLDNAPGAFMPVHVSREAPELFSVAHYGEQNGDRMADPDILFYRPEGTDDFYPATMTQHYVGRHTRCLKLEQNAQTVRIAEVYPRTYRDVAAFVTTWMRNVRHQQWSR